MLTCYSPVRRSSTPKGLSARLACVKHAASVRPEPGSNSPTKSGKNETRQQYIMLPKESTHPPPQNREDKQARIKLGTGLSSTLLSSQRTTTHPKTNPHQRSPFPGALVQPYSPCFVPSSRGLPDCGAMFGFVPVGSARSASRGFVSLQDGRCGTIRCSPVSLLLVQAYPAGCAAPNRPPCNCRCAAPPGSTATEHSS